MSIDWSMAPEEAIGAMVAQFDSSACGGATHIGKVEFICSVHERREFREGPDCWEWHEKPEATPWSGEGLPPVGAHVVVHDDGSLMYGQGESGEVLAHVDGCAVIRMSYGLGCFLPRCLRTTEQIAADERAAAIKEMVEACHYSGSECTKTDCAALYDAGYRKQVQP